MVERVEIIEGGQGLFYGTTAVSGVVNIVTKEFSDELGAHAELGYDTNDGKHVNAYVRDGFDRHHFVVFGSSDLSDGHQPFASSDYQPSQTDRNRGYDVLSLGAKYAFDFSDAWRFSSMYQYSDVKLDRTAAGRSGATQSGGRATAFNEREEQIISGKIDFTPSDMTQFFVKGYYHEWDSYYSETRNIIAEPGTIQVISDREFWGFEDYGLNFLSKFQLAENVETFLGYDFQKYGGSDEVLLIAPNSETVHAIFGQVRLTPTQNAVLAAGFRYNAPQNTGDRLIWNVSGQYNFTPNIYARANGGTAFRLPDAYELFAVDPFCCFGNPDLDPETSTNVNGSLGGNFDVGMGMLTLETIGFYRKVNDLILDVDDGTGSGNTIAMNVDDTVRVGGVTLFAGLETGSLFASASYTYTKSKGSSGVSGGYSQLPGLPNSQFQFSLDYHPMNLPFGATLTVNHVGSLTDVVSGFGNVQSGDYTIVDLAGRYFIDTDRRHRLNFRLENALDENYNTRHARFFTDDPVDPAAFLAGNVGVPRTLHFSYSFTY
jgi:vitamin B12 transporter